jgi:hypothetical protein
MLMFLVSHLKFIRSSIPFWNPLHHTKLDSCMPHVPPTQWQAVCEFGLVLCLVPAGTESHLAHPLLSNFSVLVSLPLLYMLTPPLLIDKTSMPHPPIF